MAITYVLPWLAALIISLLRQQHERIRYLLAAVSYALTGIAALVVLVWPPADVVIGGFSLITLALIIVLSGGLTVHLIQQSRYGPERPPGFYAMLLVLIGGINGVALTQFMVILFIAWGVIVFATIKLLWFGDIVRHTAADREERRKRNLDDFYNSR